MATRTDAAKMGSTTRVTESRTFDHLYDPTMTLSSARDHYRHNQRATFRPERLVNVPQYETMFSALPHFPRHTLALSGNDPVPTTVSREWPTGRADLYRPGPRPGVSKADDSVSGQERYKYFRRPIIPYMSAVLPEVLLQRAVPTAPTAMEEVRPQTPPTRTVGVQSMYRESETQTDPYTPQYYVRPGAKPEILTLAHLSWNKGLPAGIAEVEMIERARQKRAWEASLPEMSDPDAFEQRRQMMQEKELQEWREREEEIKKLQEARLQVLEQVLQRREDEMDRANDERIERIWRAKLKEKDKAMIRLEQKRVKLLRKLTDKRKHVEGNVERRDIVADYANAASRVWAPLRREGVFPDKSPGRVQVHRIDLNTLEGLQELEASLPPEVMRTTVVPPRMVLTPRDPASRRERQIQVQLEAMQENLKRKKQKASEPPPPLKYCQPIEKPPARPPMPSLDFPSAAAEQYQEALVFVQRLVRGRSVQNDMFEGKHRRQELIRELRSTHMLCEVERDALAKTEAARKLCLDARAEREKSQHQQRLIKGHMESVQGSVIGSTLDFLSKELVRLEEERRISAIVKLAERQRRMREAEEAGRRQREEQMRREEDEVFRQVMNVHQDTVESYLENILTGAVEDVSARQGEVSIRRQAEILNEVVREVEDRQKDSPESVVSMLVSSFLLPEVEKRTLRKNVQVRQRQFLMAAHKAVYAGVNRPQPSAMAAEAITELATEAAVQEIERQSKAAEPKEQESAKEEKGDFDF